MNKLLQAIIYALVGIFIFIGDRITKLKALTLYHDHYEFNQFLSFDLALNRGISWGWLHSNSTTLFVLISLLIATITMVIAMVGLRHFLAGNTIMGELLVVVGSLSNLVDRWYYHGVIDFIELSYKDYTWPVFNLADVCIVVGIFLMVTEYYKK